MLKFEDLKNVVKFEDWISQQICKQTLPDELHDKLLQICSGTIWQWTKDNGFDTADIGEAKRHIDKEYQRKFLQENPLAVINKLAISQTPKDSKSPWSAVNF